ncbi:D-tyrosyl-tRNA(Tyr) deacylase [Prosthecochloris sp. GSB1]|uniref:D-aminoacyl-tRNA deacylase n=1 Tax=Prosthecochloris sp. GSB1 TaxID=281093 RepID=UPI000B8CDE5D|nr:D-aminoacyl-tRNA deacylase [Prosthecochloris sp. GSB1]ASQ91188.1 D-tyrosyl-tRNA(Tyr) deacylase [Prosthecochloris sp. GSB1]
MRAVLQRVSEASVMIDGSMRSSIGKGLLVLLAVAPGDGEREIGWMIRKILSLRVFEDEAGKMNRSVCDVGGELLLVSQFTLYADTTTGNRPGFSASASYREAEEIYDRFVASMDEATSLRVGTGCFGGDMQVSLTNDGPVTLIVDTPPGFARNPR